jgi:DNA-directed RNA polymerase specialized sigma subunit
MIDFKRISRFVRKLEGQQATVMRCLYEDRLTYGQTSRILRITVAKVQQEELSALRTMVQFMSAKRKPRSPAGALVGKDHQRGVGSSPVEA